jgi:hypothetical protein
MRIRAVVFKLGDSAPRRHTTDTRYTAVYKSCKLQSRDPICDGVLYIAVSLCKKLFNDALIVTAVKCRLNLKAGLR